MYTRLLFLVLCIIQFSCDKQSNPFIGDDPVFYLENMTGESRDVLVLEDISFDVFTCNDLEEQVCIDDLWCGWDNDACINVTNDLLIVANQYEEGLIIYDINTSDEDIELNEIYHNNNFEVLDGNSLENDLELRHLIYSEEYQMLYILDKFEYIYNAWLPGLLEQSTQSYNDICYDFGGINSDGIWDPAPTSVFSNESLHSTHIVMDESNTGSLDEVLFLLKYNSDISSESVIPNPSQTSCSQMGVYSFDLPPVLNDGYHAACNAEFVSTIYSTSISPLFDYRVSDVYLNNNKIFLSNPYDSFVFKDSFGNDLDINYYDGTIEDGCGLSKNTIAFSSKGELFYNLDSEVSYFEFNVINTDLLGYFTNNFSCDGISDYFIEYPSDCFEGFINNQNDFSVSISGNKVMGYTSPSGENIVAQCGTLIDLEINSDDLAQIVHDGIYSFSIYEYNPLNELILFSDDVQTVSKVSSIYSYNNSGDTYILAGLIDGGCYITLLGQGSPTMTKLGGDSFTVNDIYYDDDNNMLFLSCGSDGVLVYEWIANSTSASFINHIISSHAYTARLYISDEDHYYVVVATKYGVEIYKL